LRLEFFSFFFLFFFSKDLPFQKVSLFAELFLEALQEHYARIILDALRPYFAPDQRFLFYFYFIFLKKNLIPKLIILVINQPNDQMKKIHLLNLSQKNKK